jgi:hypothetical protein
METPAHTRDCTGIKPNEEGSTHRRILKSDDDHIG